MKSHTPGRLEMFEDDESIGVAAGDNILARMTVYSTDDPDYPDDVQRANATLWAAAPKLLAACQVAQASFELIRLHDKKVGKKTIQQVEILERHGWAGSEFHDQFASRVLREAISSALPRPATGESAGAGGATGTE